MNENDEVISIDSSSNSDRLQIDDECNDSNESDKVSGKSALREIESASTIAGNTNIEISANTVDDKSRTFKESGSAVQQILDQNIKEVFKVSDPTVSVQVNEGEEISVRQKGESSVLTTTTSISTIQVNIVIENEENSNNVEAITDPLNIGQVSLMTDDNSVHSDKSSLLCSENLDKFDEKVEASKALETGKNISIMMNIFLVI